MTRKGMSPKQYAYVARLKDQRNERVGRVAALYIKGTPIRQIAELLLLNVRRVHRDIGHARQAWKEAAREELKALLAKELARIDLVETEAWSAWNRSQQVAIEKSKEVSRDAEGKSTKRTTKQRKQVGEAMFLKVALECVVQRAKLLGLDKQDEGDGDDIQIQAVEVIVGTREQAESMLEYEEFRSIVKR